MHSRTPDGYTVLSTETYYGRGYCGICGVRETPPLVPERVRWWDPDDGWRIGVLCAHCRQHCRPPDPDDYAYPRHREGQMIDALAPELADAQDTLWDL